MLIWGVWINATFYFSAGEHSVKARNLLSNPNCFFCPGDAGEAVILEGVAERLADKKLQARVAKVYFQKYEWDPSELNQFIFAIRPKTAFGQIEKTFTQIATRWTFGGPSKHGAL
jgi:Pyridoxamine 5'-phosphate oxidase